MVKRTGSGSDELRKLADKLAAGSPRIIRETSVADIQKLVHELNVHQVELEMQNEELRQLQLELQEARDKYQALYKFMPTGYCTLERNFVIVEANPALGEMVGMDEHKLCGRKLTNFIAPDSQESFYFYKRKMGTNDGKSTCELKLLRADKTSFYVHMMSNVILEQDEHTRRYHVSITDISELKQTEEELQLRAQLLDSASDMIMLHAHNPDQPLMYVNEMMCQSLGYSREELLAMNMRRFVVPEIQSQFPSRHQILDDKGINHFESVWVRKDGSMLPVEVNARLVEIGGRRLVLASARDITERRKLETEQRELEQIAHITSRLASVGELAAGIAHEINNPLTGVIGYAELLQQEDLPEHVQKDLKTINDGAQRVASIVKRLLTFAFHCLWGA